MAREGMVECVKYARDDASGAERIRKYQNGEGRKIMMALLLGLCEETSERMT